MLLSLLTLSQSRYIVLDLKDALFCILLSSVLQELFAFELEKPEGGCKCQLTRTRLPQGFIVFGEALSRDLVPFGQEHLGASLIHR